MSTAVTWTSAFLYAIAMILLAPWLADKTLAAPHLAPLLRISAFTVAFGVINGVQTSSLAGCEAFRSNTQVGVAASLLQSALVFAGAWRWGIRGAVAALAISMFATVVLTRWYVVKEWRRYRLRLCWRDARTEWRVLLDFSLPTFLSGMLVGPVLWGAGALLAHRPDGYVELGVYNAANQWQQAVQLLPGLMGTALLPVLSDKCGSGDWRGSLSVVRKMMKMVAWTVLPMAGLLSLASPWIMRGYGESFVSGYGALIISVFTAALLAIMVPIGHFITASGRMWIGFWMNAGWGAAMLVASWWMVRWGAEGLAGARLVAYLLHATWTFGFVWAMKRRLDGVSLP